VRQHRGRMQSKLSAGTNSLGHRSPKRSHSRRWNGSSRGRGSSWAMKAKSRIRAIFFVSSMSEESVILCRDREGKVGHEPEKAERPEASPRAAASLWRSHGTTAPDEDRHRHQPARAFGICHGLAVPLRTTVRGRPAAPANPYIGAAKRRRMWPSSRFRSPLFFRKK
jgi:hypothetical protein